MEASIINEEVKIHNRKLNSLTSKYRHTSVMQLELAREALQSMVSTEGMQVKTSLYHL
jgi:hypothetical protein